MNLQFIYTPLFTAVCVSVLVSCGGTGQDDGRVAQENFDYRGLTIDPYLARATVYLDTNNDGTRNAWEPFAFTDNQGYFSYNPITDTDYCAATATAEQAQYCLRTTAQYSNVVIRVDSGYDVVTGEPFAGQMSRRLTPQNGDPGEDNSVVTPISSLVTNIDNSEEQGTVLNTLGLDSQDLDVDYLNTDGNGSVDSGILNAALKVHKVVTILGDRITDTYDEIGEEVGTPNDATAAVYSELAQQLLTSGQNFDETVNNGTSLATVLDNAEEVMRAVYQQKEFDLPADMGSASNPDQFSRVIDVASNVVTVVNSLIDPNASDVNQNDIVGQTRAIESVAIKALEETGIDSSIENATNFFSDPNNTELVDSLLNGLASDTADISSLSQNDFSGSDFDSAEEVSDASQLPDDAQPFTQIAGLQLKVSDLDLGSAPNNLDDAEIELYFSGEANDTDGEFLACVKFIDGASIDGTLGDGNTRGELVEGFWSLLGASQDNRQSYSLLLTITFLETTYQAIMKPAGQETIGGVNYNRIRFDNDGEINVWHSAQGFVELGSLPVSDSECETRLPSRVGL